MSNVIPFPLKAVKPGGVLCPPLNLRFPVVFRGDAKTTKEDLDKWGLAGDEFAPSEWTVYELATDYNVVGSIRWHEVRSLDPDWKTSLVIRHHTSLEYAYGYASALSDQEIGKEGTCDQVVYTTETGIFTKASIPTLGSWPGPLIIYSAVVPANNPMGSDYWFKIIGHTGEEIDGSALDIS